MLSKWDEAASPWALIKGLTENPLPVSCVSEDVRISCGMASFDPDRLAQLALLPLASLAPKLEGKLALTPADSMGVSDLPSTTLKKRRSANTQATGVKPMTAVKPKPSKVLKTDDILIPTLMDATSAPRSRSRSVNTSCALKVVNG